MLLRFKDCNSGLIVKEIDEDVVPVTEDEVIIHTNGQTWAGIVISRSYKYSDKHPPTGQRHSEVVLTCITKEQFTSPPINEKIKVMKKKLRKAYYEQLEEEKNGN